MDTTYGASPGLDGHPTGPYRDRHGSPTAPSNSSSQYLAKTGNRSLLSAKPRAGSLVSTMPNQMSSAPTSMGFPPAFSISHATASGSPTFLTRKETSGAAD